jgi:hypothetical protein
MRWACACVLAALAACGGDSKAIPKDAGPADTGAVDAAADAPIDGPGGSLSKACVDRPNDLVPHAPTARLPCELIPPGR